MARADEVVFLWLNGLAGSFYPLDRALEWVVSDYLVPATMAMALIALWILGTDVSVRTKNQIGVLLALGSMAISSGVVFIINLLYFRDRPFSELDVTLLFYEPTDSSFPSNSAAAMFGMAAAVWCTNKKLGLGLFIIASLFGISRVIAGVHYPLDILGAFVIGMIVAYIIFRIRYLVGPWLAVFIKTARILCLA